MFFKHIVCIILSFLFALVLHAQEENNALDMDANKRKERYFLAAQLEEIKSEQKKTKKILDKNGFFVGVGIGSGEFSQNLDIHYPLMFALKGGYQKSFGNTPVGVRVYGEFDLIGIPVKPLNFYHTASINLDATMDFLLDKNFSYGVGFFAGIGLGGVYGYIDRQALGLWSSFFNFGISAIMNIRHRIEFGIRLPSASKLKARNFEDINASKMFFASYLYKF